MTNMLTMLTDNGSTLAHEIADAIVNQGGYADDSAEANRRAEERDRIESIVFAALSEFDGAGAELRATDGVSYYPVLGGWKAERAPGFALKDGEQTVDTFASETYAWKAASEIAGQPGREEIDVVPIEPGTEFIYLNPSAETDDGVPNVFLYQGANGDPALDEPLMHFVVFDHHCSECGLHRDDGHMPGCSKGPM